MIDLSDKTINWKLIRPQTEAYKGADTEYARHEQLQVLANGELLFGKHVLGPQGQPIGFEAERIIAPGHWAEVSKSDIQTKMQ
jgi:hypothetical protein